MVKISVLKVLAVTSFLLGVVYLFNAFSGLTGFVVIDDAGGSLRAFFGIVFVLVGILAFLGARESK